MSFTLKKFETAGEIEEKKKKRQEEWEKVRKPDDPEECPEAPVDNRCLYDKLEEQKQRKQDELDEQYALKNQVKGLDEDESKFLEFVETRQQEISRERKQEERQLLEEMKQDAQVVKITDVKTEEKRIKSASTTQSNRKTQSALLAGAVKRKGSEDSSPAKKSKSEAVEPSSSSSPNTQTSVEPETSNIPTAEGTSTQTTQPSRPQVATVIGVLPSVLPGLNQYSDTSDSQSSSSDSEGEFTLGQRNQIAMAMREIKQQLQQQSQ